MVGSIGTSQLPGYISRANRPEVSEQTQPDLMPMRRPGTEVQNNREQKEIQEAAQKAEETRKDPEFLLHHTRATLEERMEQALSEKDIKMILYMTARIPRTEDMNPEPGRLFDTLG